jgi:histone H3/H4
MREIAQNAVPRYVSAARVKIASLLEEYTRHVIKKAVIIARRYFSATAALSRGETSLSNSRSKR